MTDTVALFDAAKGVGVTIVFLASKAGMSRRSFYKKAQNETEFKASEIAIISDALHLTTEERDKIFFARNSD